MFKVNVIIRDIIRLNVLDNRKRSLIEFVLTKGP